MIKENPHQIGRILDFYWRWCLIIYFLKSFEFGSFPFWTISLNIIHKPHLQAPSEFHVLQWSFWIHSDSDLRH